MISGMTAQVWIALVLGLAATINDLKSREIADWIPLTALASGIAWQAGLYGWMGAAYAVGGAVVGFVVFLLFYLLGGMGGGDVKLMAGFGALLGSWRPLEAALWTAGVGGIFAIGAIAWRTWRKRQLAKRGIELAEDDSIPYAPAIVVGVLLALVPKG